MNGTLRSEVFRYLHSVRHLYPGGIPHAIPSPSPRLGFIVVVEDPSTPLQEAEGALLRGAVEKGLRLKFEDVLLIKLSPDGEAQKSQLAAACAKQRPKILILLGAALGLGAADRGARDSFEGIPVVVTHSLEAILRDPTVKREFWEDLKGAASI